MNTIHKKTTAILFSLIAYSSVFAQETVSFEEISSTIKNFYFASSDVGDFDNDGDLDIVLCGGTDSFNAGGPTETACHLYRNDNGVYTEVTSFAINPLHLGDVKFIDQDNDGDLDIVISGQNYENIMDHYLYIYKNNGGNFELFQQSAGLIYSAIDVADFNNDGKQDFLITGVGSLTGNFSHLFTNNGNFAASNLSIPKIQNGNLRVFDFNNDNQLDIAILGIDTNGNYVFQIYKNIAGTLTLHQEFAPLGFGTLEIADFNADGYLDIVASGYDDNLGNLTKVYFNNSQGNFTEALSEEGLDLASGSKNIAVADINNDGYYDFLVSGDNEDYEGTVNSYVFNPVTQNFSKLTYDTGIFGMGGTSNIQLFDYDADNHPDVLLSGFAEDEAGEYVSFTKLFKSGITSANAAPTPPATFNSSVSSNTINFSWDGASDDKTPQNALTYYFKAGTTSGSKDLAYYPVTTKSWKLQLANLPQTIYWSIESVDASLVKSIASEEQILATLSVSENFALSNLKTYPNPTTSFVTIQSDLEIENIAVYNQVGQLVSNQKNTQVDLSNVASGIYILHLDFENGQKSVQKIIKK